jgi:hypothetical protein
LPRELEIGQPAVEEHDRLLVSPLGRSSRRGELFATLIEAIKDGRVDALFLSMLVVVPPSTRSAIASNSCSFPPPRYPSRMELWVRARAIRTGSSSSFASSRAART